MSSVGRQGGLSSIEPARRPHGSAAVILALVSFALLLLAMPRDLNIYDEGIVLTDALRVLHGDVVHRDFYSNYGPGQYYAVAAWFAVFGKHFLVARLYDLAIRAAMVGVLFHILARRTAPLVALYFAGVAGLWLASIGSYLYPIYPCLLLALIGTELVTGVAERRAVSPATGVAGACAGLAALFRYDLGFFLLIANLATIGALAVQWPAGPRARRALAAMATYAAGTAAVFLPAAALFLMASPVKPFADDIVDYSVKYYRAMRGLPFPGLGDLRKGPSNVAVYVPVVAAGLAAVTLAMRQVRHSRTTPQAQDDGLAVACLVAFSATAAMMFLKGTVRVSPLHMLPAVVPALIVMALLVEAWRHRGVPMTIVAAALALFAVLPAERFAAKELAQDRREPARSMAGWLLVHDQIERLPPGRQPCDRGPASGAARLEPDYARVSAYIADHTRPGEPVLIALNRHDRIFENPVGLYFAAGRPPATHWHQFDPGLQTRADIQAAIIAELRRKQVRLVVRDATYESMSEPNGSAVSSGVFLLDGYLNSHYRPVAASGLVSVWLLKTEAPVAYAPHGACEASSVGPPSETLGAP